MFRHWLLAVVIVSGSWLAACGKSTSPAADPAQAVASQPHPAAAFPSGKSPQRFNVASVFPPGPGREMVLNTCGSCHPVVCAARGQRTAERWESIKEGHKD